jgi:hypothetical protein
MFKVKTQKKYINNSISVMEFDTPLTFNSHKLFAISWCAIRYKDGKELKTIEQRELQNVENFAEEKRIISNCSESNCYIQVTKNNMCWLITL